MPELPEVEEVRRSLEPLILGRKVLAVGVHRTDFVTPHGVDLARLRGRCFVQTLRRGKKLFFVLDDGQTLHFHLGMTGFIECCGQEITPEAHTHFTLTLDRGVELRFSDPRRFGGVWYYATSEEAWESEVTHRLGPDALTLRVEDLAHWKNTRGRLKARLLNQRDVAGLGNIYVDESLWMAHLHPLQLVARISPLQCVALVKAVRSILRRSVAQGGTTLRDYRNATGEAGRFSQRLRVYGRGGKPCLRCAATLRSIITAGRTTVYCPACQPRR